MNPPPYKLDLISQPDGAVCVALVQDDGSTVAFGASIDVLCDDVVRALREGDAVPLRVPERLRPLVAHKIRVYPWIIGFGLTTPLWSALAFWRL